MLTLEKTYCLVVPCGELGLLDKQSEAILLGRALCGGCCSCGLLLGRRRGRCSCCRFRSTLACTRRWFLGRWSRLAALCFGSGTAAAAALCASTWFLTATVAVATPAAVAALVAIHTDGGLVSGSPALIDGVAGIPAATDAPAVAGLLRHAVLVAMPVPHGCLLSHLDRGTGVRVLVHLQLDFLLWILQGAVRDPVVEVHDETWMRERDYN